MVSRSSVSRFMRVAFLRMVDRKLACLRTQRGLVIEQGLDVSADRGQRRTQLMGDIGDELALRPLDVLDAGDVMNQGNGTSRGHRGCVDLEDLSRYEGGGATLAEGPLLDGESNTLEHVRITNGLHQRVSDSNAAASGRSVNPRRKEALDSLIGPLDSAGRVDGDDRVLEAVDHGLELVPARGGLVECALHFAGGASEGASEGVEVAVVLVEDAVRQVGGEGTCRSVLPVTGPPGQSGGGVLQRNDACSNGACEQVGAQRRPTENQQGGQQPSVRHEPGADGDDQSHRKGEADEESEEEATGHRWRA